MSNQESFEDIILAVHRLDIPKDEMILVGGAALNLFGIRTSNTIDLVVSPQAMVGFLEKADDNTCFAYKLGHIGIMTRVKALGLGRDNNGYAGEVTFMPPPSDHLYQATFNQLLSEAVKVSDVLVSPPQRILNWKKSVGRKIDLDDVELIENYLLANTKTENNLHLNQASKDLVSIL